MTDKFPGVEPWRITAEPNDPKPAHCPQEGDCHGLQIKRGLFCKAQQMEYTRCMLCEAASEPEALAEQPPCNCPDDITTPDAP